MKVKPEDYKLVLSQGQDDKGGIEFVVECLEIPYLCGLGATANEAYNDVIENLQLMIDEAYADPNINMPLPFNDNN